MAPVTLPPSFFNSFWSPDYRSGIEVLFKALDQGCIENEDISAFIESQARGHNVLANTLLALPKTKASSATSSSLQHSLLSLRGASSARGEAHRALAEELERKVLAGFKQWKDRHADRIHNAKEDMLAKTGVVGVWEKDVQRLMTLRQTYLVKSRAADDSEDDAKFAPATTMSPPRQPASTFTQPPSPQSSGLRRTGTVSDRISEKLHAARVTSSGSSGPRPLSIEGKILPAPPSPVPSPGPNDSPGSPTREEAFVPPTHPDGKPTIQNGDNGPRSPNSDGSRESTDIPPQPILLSGLALPAQALQDLLHRFEAHLLMMPAPYSDASAAQSTRSNLALASRQRTTILGTYEKTFSGEEVVSWLRDNVEGFGGDHERAVDAAGELYRMGHFSRIGVGRGFEPNWDTYYILKVRPTTSSTRDLLSQSPLSPTTTANIQNMMKNFLPAGMGNSDEPLHIRLRRDAVKADESYREGVRIVEERRLEMEERIERGLRTWERWERERLGVVKSVLKQYEEAIARLGPRLTALIESTSLSVEAFNPDADLKALIDGNRTGPFRPQPHTYESVESDIPEVNFGIDLRRWSGELGWRGMVNAPQRPKGSVPEVLECLLGCLAEMYGSIPEDERRKAWIYEVPLIETHALRNVINKPHLPKEEMQRAIQQFNVPVVAGVVKLYLLELNPPVMGWEGWEDAKAVYPQIGADQERDTTSALTSVLARLPSIHLYVLNALVKHFVDLVESTKTDEPNDIYITKLALSVGRCVLRPQYDTEITIGDRTPSLFLADLIRHYPNLLPPLVDKKKKESERVMPVRKRTALVDQRMSRAKMAELDEGEEPLPPIPGKSKGLPPTLGLGAPLMEEPEESSPSPSAPKTSSIRTSSPIPPPAARAPRVESPELEETFVPPVQTSNEANFGTPKRQKSPTESGHPEEMTSPTASILETMETQSAVPEDIVASEGASGLKRATSGENAQSRLRGPRGARGPRPAGARVASGAAVPLAHSASTASNSSAGVGSGGGSTVTSPTMMESAIPPVPDQEGAAVAGAGGATGLRRGGRVHKQGSSVSQAIDKFERRG